MSAHEHIHAAIEGSLMQGQYDRVHVGASCPPDRLAALVPLLRPQGGIIVTPVSPNDLRMISVNAEGDVTQKVISQVRYSELEVMRPPPCTQCCHLCHVQGIHEVHVCQISSMHESTRLTPWFT